MILVCSKCLKAIIKLEDAKLYRGYVNHLAYRYGQGYHQCRCDEHYGYEDLDVIQYYLVTKLVT